MQRKHFKQDKTAEQLAHELIQMFRFDPLSTIA